MKVIKVEDDLLEFDNGVSIIGEGDIDCCAQNFLDFSQFTVGDKFPTMSLGQLVDAIKLKDDGFFLKDSQSLPKWAQARSYQNGYYSNMTTVYAKEGEKSIKLGELSGDESDD